MLMMGKQLSAQQRVTKAVVDIMGNDKYVALAGVLMIGSRTVGAVPTACTNGRDEIYGEEFVNKLNDAELRFLVLHENYHKLYRHLTTWRELYEIDARLANMACDYVINLKIHNDNVADKFAVMPSCGLLDTRFTNMSAAEVFNILRKEGGGGRGGNEKGDGGKKGGTGIPEDSMDDHDWEGAEELTEQEKKELERDIDEAVRQGALAAGKVGSGADRDLEELLKTKVDWREVLREFITTTCVGKDYATWKRPNRRFIASGVYMPSTISERVDELVIAIDTSGSIGGRELAQFLGEVKGICETVKPAAVRLLYWDTRVAGDETYVDGEVENIVKSTKPRGGGGTSVSCVSNYMTEQGIKAQAVIVLTDGYLGSDWGSFTTPVLWCIVGNKTTTAPYGKTVHVDD